MMTMMIMTNPRIHVTHNTPCFTKKMMLIFMMPHTMIAAMMTKIIMKTTTVMMMLTIMMMMMMIPVHPLIPLWTSLNYLRSK